IVRFFRERAAEQFYGFSVVDCAVCRYGTLEVGCGEISKQGRRVRLSIEKWTKSSNGLVIASFEKLNFAAGHQHGFVVRSRRQALLNQVFGSKQIRWLGKS